MAHDTLEDKILAARWETIRSERIKDNPKTRECRLRLTDDEMDLLYVVLEAIEKTDTSMLLLGYDSPASISQLREMFMLFLDDRYTQYGDHGMNTFEIVFTPGKA